MRKCTNTQHFNLLYTEDTFVSGAMSVKLICQLSKWCRTKYGKEFKG